MQPQHQAAPVPVPAQVMYQVLDKYVLLCAVSECQLLSDPRVCATESPTSWGFARTWRSSTPLVTKCGLVQLA